MQGIDEVYVFNARTNEDRVRDMLRACFPPRRPSIRALKLTGTCLHPARIG
jgi:hypothetical protein